MGIRVIAVASIGGIAALASGVGAQSHPAEPVPQEVVPTARLLDGAPIASIAGGGLRVTVALPDARRGFYRSTRFDWSGMILQATAGRTSFYGPWSDGVAENVRDFVDTPTGVIAGPRNAASGPAEEFANRDGETVPGYDSTPAGGTFIKIGVGRLRKPDDASYDHFRAYAIVDGGQWRIRRSANRIVFVQRVAADARGYGYVYEKTLAIAADGTMTISHRLRNIGSRPIRTQVYNHNFARFDGGEIGRGVVVTFPYAAQGPVSDPRLAKLDGRLLRYLEPLRPGDRVQLPPQPGGVGRAAGPFRVAAPDGASITMTADVPLVRTAVWSMRRTVAVEPFVAIDVSPGRDQRWAWRYTFAPGMPN